ncbi:MAG: hypothetical protein IPM92_00685 [Saprospiraceae bacterium]|nr:hypothetical protein [Saprospiraceae bacterium]
MILLICYQDGFSQSSAVCDIAMIGRLAEPKNDCDINTSAFPSVCLKLKFHFIKYQGSPEEFPTDKLYIDLLDQLNEIFDEGNIKFTFGGDCINYIEYNQTFNTGSQSNDAAQRKSTVLNDKTTFGFDEEAINVYSFTKSGGGEAYRGENILFCASNVSAMAHELGHTLGLWHTFGKGNPLTDKEPFAKPWVCKDGSNESSFQGDDIADTGADPYTMDLDNNGKADEWKWFIEASCSQNISPAQKDDCDDQTNSWNIPLDNWMSYYGQCKKCFSQGQYEMMHIYIEDFFEEMIQTDCDTDPYFNPVNCQLADITISTPVIWENGTAEMCKDQKIIIEAGGSLTLRNYKITKKHGTNPACPGLSKYGEWDGIYLSGFSAGNSSEKPSLLVLENSEISHSNNGIKANQFKEIRFDQSQMKSNGSGIVARHGAYGVYIMNNSFIDGSSSKINETNRAKYREIELINTGALISSSIITGKGLSTGIYSYYGTLRVVNQSTIKNFETCIYKDADKVNGGFDSFGSSGAGLLVSNSKVMANLDKYESIYLNDTKDAVVFDNDLFGIVNSRGKSSGVWIHNLIKGEHSAVNYVSIIRPELAYEFRDNLLDDTRMEFYGNNALTNAECNSWLEPQGYAVNNQASPFISSWGTADRSSGNRVTTNKFPILNAQYADVVNYFKSGEPNELKFVYLNKFIGRGIDDGSNCNYRLTEGPGTDQWIESCQENEAEANWDSLEIVRLSLVDQIENSQDSVLIQNWTEQLDQVLLQQSQLSANMIRCHRQDSVWTTQGDLWIDRQDPELHDLNDLSQLWNGENFQQILEFEGIPLVEQVDFEVLETAAQLLKDWQADSIDIYNLPLDSLNALVDHAQSQYGTYSNYLRSWLHAYYGIRMDWPAELQSYARIPPKKLQQKPNEMNILPNPVLDCFRIKADTEIQKWTLNLQNLQGICIHKMQFDLNEEICIPKHIQSGLYLIKLTAVSSPAVLVGKLWIR